MCLGEVCVFIDGVRSVFSGLLFAFLSLNLDWIGVQRTHIATVVVFENYHLFLDE